MMTTLTRYLDLIGQNLTSAPMWIQVIVVLAGTVPLCLLLAFMLLRGIDIISARTYRALTGRGAERGAGSREQLAASRARLADYKPAGSRIVINEEPR